MEKPEPSNVFFSLYLKNYKQFLLFLFEKLEATFAWPESR